MLVKDLLETLEDYGEHLPVVVEDTSLTDKDKKYYDIVVEDQIVDGILSVVIARA